MPPQPLSYSILWCFQSPGGRCDTDVLFRAKHCAIIDSLQFVQLWVSVLTAIQCSKRLSWWKLRAALIYGFKDNHLEGSLTFCWVSRMIEGSRSCEFPNYRFLVLCMSSILWNGLNSNQKVAGYASIVPLGTSCYSLNFCSFRGSQPIRLLMVFFLSQAAWVSTFQSYES